METSSDLHVKSFSPSPPFVSHLLIRQEHRVPVSVRGVRASRLERQQFNLVFPPQRGLAVQCLMRRRAALEAQGSYTQGLSACVVPSARLELRHRALLPLCQAECLCFSRPWKWDHHCLLVLQKRYRFSFALPENEKADPPAGVEDQLFPCCAHSQVGFPRHLECSVHT